MNKPREHYIKKASSAQTAMHVLTCEPKILNIKGTDRTVVVAGSGSEMNLFTFDCRMNRAWRPKDSIKRVLTYSKKYWLTCAESLYYNYNEGINASRKLYKITCFYLLWCSSTFVTVQIGDNVLKKNRLKNSILYGITLRRHHYPETSDCLRLK